MQDAHAASRAHATARPHAGLKHPLMGADVATLARALHRFGPVPARRWPQVLAFLGSALGRAPLTLLEAAWAERRLRRDPPTDPVFVVGHWRTGTTHLHNVLGAAPEFGHISPLASGLPWNLFTLVAWLRPLLERALPSDRGVDRVAVHPTAPQEDEIPLASMQPLSVFHAVYFPRDFRATFDRGVFFDGASAADVERWKRRHRTFIGKVQLQQRKRLVVKNPVYTGRIALLRSIWPDARFVHIVRDPYVVYRSTLHYYRKLLPELALQPYDHVDLETFVLDGYARLMSRYEAQAADVPPTHLIQLRYEDFEREPLPCLERLWAQLELGDFERSRPALSRYLDSVARYEKNAYPDLDPREVERIEANWGDFIERFGYQRAGSPV